MGSIKKVKLSVRHEKNDHNSLGVIKANKKYSNINTKLQTETRILNDGQLT